MLDSHNHLDTHSSEQQHSIVHICGRYRVGKLLGCGTFSKSFWLRSFNFTKPLLGNVYLGWDIKMGQDVVLKFEPIQSWHDWLCHKHSVYKVLSNVADIPSMHWYGREAPYNVLILNCLNLTLEESIFKHHDISLVFSFANQMVFLFSALYNLRHLAHITLLQLSCLESIHSWNYIHQDVKPTNFMTGIGELHSQTFLIDFGLAQLFHNPSTHWHVLLISGLKTVGTIAFTSINSHLELTQSCCDDLQSLIYSIVYLFCGWLPWQDIKAGSIERYKDVVLEKKTALVKAPCQGLPLPFVTFAQHIQLLGFDEKSQYDYLHTLPTQCSVHDSKDVVLDLTTLLHSPCKVGVPTTLPCGQRMWVQHFTLLLLDLS